MCVEGVRVGWISLFIDELDFWLNLDGTIEVRGLAADCSACIEVLGWSKVCCRREGFYGRPTRPLLKGQPT